MDTFNMDLTDRFSPVEHAGAAASLMRRLSVTRKGSRRDAIVLVAPARIRASLHDVSGRLTLEGLAAPVFNLGDGIQMDISLMHSGTQRVVASRYYDSGRKAEDRDWAAISTPIEIDAAGDSQLEIRVSAGPQGDLVGDWLALSSLSLVRRIAER